MLHTILTKSIQMANQFHWYLIPMDKCWN